MGRLHLPRDRIPRPRRTRSYVIGAMLGAAGAVAAHLAGPALGLSTDPVYGTTIGSALIVGGFLLVPASVFAPVVGAMFPQYWNATPVSVIRDAPLPWLLLVLAIVVGYGSVAVILPPTVLLALCLVVPVAIGAVLAVVLIAYSLSWLDPDHVIDRLRRDCLEGDAARAAVAFGDLCRFVRGMGERRRREVVARGIGYMADCWTKRHADLPRERRQLARNVLDDCVKHWPGKSDIGERAEKCRAVLGELPARP